MTRLLTLNLEQVETCPYLQVIFEVLIEEDSDNLPGCRH